MQDKFFKYAICSKMQQVTELLILYWFNLLCVEGIGLPEQTHSELRKLRNRESCYIC